MALKYIGTLPQHINDIPATDLSDEEITAIGQRPEYNLSLAEMEGLLISRKIYTYASAPKSVTKATKIEKDES